jgi:hypothetical protein
VSAKAFFVTAGGNRFNGCYADGGRCVFVGGGLSKNRWMNGFECCAGGGLGGINHGIILAGDSIGPGLEITHNMFNGGSVWHEPAPNTSSDRDIRAHVHSMAPPGDCATAFKYNTTGLQCNDLQQDPSAKTADACRQRCCAEQAQGSCNVWQFSGDGDGGGCWFDPSIGNVDCVPEHNAGPWLGGATQDPSAGGNAKIVGTRIADNSFSGQSGVGTRASMTASGPGSNFTLDFCEHLVFKNIALVRSLTVVDGATAGLTAHALPPQGCSINVITSSPLTKSGMLFVEVDSSTYTGAFV